MNVGTIYDGVGGRVRRCKVLLRRKSLLRLLLLLLLLLLLISQEFVRVPPRISHEFGGPLSLRGAARTSQIS